MHLYLYSSLVGFLQENTLFLVLLLDDYFSQEDKASLTAVKSINYLS